MAILGAVFILFAILYLIFHLIRSLFSTKYHLSKRIFYPSFIGGILLFTVAMVVEDTRAAQKLELVTSEDTELKNEITALKEEVQSLTQKVTDAEELNTELEKAKTAAASEKQQSCYA